MFKRFALGQVVHMVEVEGLHLNPIVGWAFGWIGLGI